MVNNMNGLRFTRGDVEKIVGLGYRFAGTNFVSVRNFDDYRSDKAIEAGVRTHIRTRPYDLILLEASGSEIEISLIDLAYALENRVYESRPNPTVAIVNDGKRRSSDNIGFINASRIGSIIDLCLSGAVNHRTSKRVTRDIGNRLI